MVLFVVLCDVVWFSAGIFVVLFCSALRLFALLVRCFCFQWSEFGIVDNLKLFSEFVCCFLSTKLLKFDQSFSKVYFIILDMFPNCVECVCDIFVV